MEASLWMSAPAWLAHPSEYFSQDSRSILPTAPSNASARTIVSASIPGKGVDSKTGIVTFNPLQENERPALTLAGGILYVAYGSFADTDPYHGWVLGFNATNLQQLTNYIFNTTPNATVAIFGANAAEGALWMGGNGLSVDASNNLYFETANGSFSANTNGGDYSDSFVRLSSPMALWRRTILRLLTSLAWRRAMPILAPAGRCFCRIQWVAPCTHILSSVPESKESSTWWIGTTWVNII